ncbi:MAG: 50S ribosomal protein L29 [Parachlamydiaceae bacterium]|nr:50S ribosomal protein L29 [Parachlamydiaceae bacterium]
MTKARDLRDQSSEELVSALDDARKDLFKLRSEVIQGGNVERPHRIALQRKDIARMLTILHEKQSANRAT